VNITNNSGGMMSDKNDTSLLSEAFSKGDVYLDYPYEDVMFRYEKKTGKVFSKFYNETESEIDPTSSLYLDAFCGGQLIDKDRYFESDKSKQ